MSFIKLLVNLFSRNRLGWHRIHVKNGDPADPKVPNLAQVKRRVLGVYWTWNWADNPRRAAMHEFVKHYYAAEEALAILKARERDNENAINTARHNAWADGVSKPYQFERIPREPGLIPIPLEFGELRKRFERADSGRPKPRLPIDPDGGPLTAFVPDGATLPDIKLDGHEFKQWGWDVNRGKQQEQQKGQRRRGKGNGGDQGGQNPGHVTLRIED